MIRLKRFQRTLIIALSALNSLVYCISKSFSIEETVLITFFLTGGVALFVFAYVYFQNNSQRKKARLKSE
ncbi:hypothetical protein [Fluviicola taffensis]|uniref:Uncharacterized protein n=1 Tax=Fluviicola taffensis (strain DSM 16823 / NCIMB 13979 / RW262) TaxID=755732 RepID=F2IJL1_FLUTR|nr:hypothetical protein [Fluviicola taffensis]AEA42899.1 hypothetical protein Fluta_0898 [Fluviicola taffensis DSM 16823]